jgi:hypothetical protein
MFFWSLRAQRFSLSLTTGGTLILAIPLAIPLPRKPLDPTPLQYNQLIITCFVCARAEGLAFGEDVAMNGNC